MVGVQQVLQPSPPSTYRVRLAVAHWLVMTAISIHELHEHTDLWVRKATHLEPIVVTADGVAVAKIVPFTADVSENPFLHRKLLPGFAELQETLTAGTDSTEIISEMRDRE